MYRASWHDLPHLDVASAYKQWCEDNDIPWKLKPTCEGRGVKMVPVSQERMHELSDEERNAYAMSDVMGMRRTVLADYVEMGLAGHVDLLAA